MNVDRMLKWQKWLGITIVILMVLIWLTRIFANTRSPYIILSKPDSYGFVEVRKLVSVYDGDTFKVNIGNLWPDIIGKEIGIRVNGIDTPEIRGTTGIIKEKAIEARELVKDILTNAKIIHLNNMERGKYFRIVADIIVDGNDLATMLIEKGLAKSYNGGTKPSWDPNDF